MQHPVSPPHTDTTSSKSLTDLWRDVIAADTGSDHEYSTALRAFDRRLDEIQARLDQDVIAQHAQLEHPHQPWDAQAAVFTTGRFAEERAR